MKFFIAVAFLFAAACAAPQEQSELFYPLKDFYEYMQCVPKTADEATKKHGCEAVWGEYRQNFLNKVTDFENCAKLPTNKADACRYKMYAASESVLKRFYYTLHVNKDKCKRVVPRAILECQSDEMRYSPDF